MASEYYYDSDGAISVSHDSFEPNDFGDKIFKKVQSPYIFEFFDVNNYKEIVRIAGSNDVSAFSLKGVIARTIKLNVRREPNVDNETNYPIGQLGDDDGSYLETFKVEIIGKKGENWKNRWYKVKFSEQQILNIKQKSETKIPDKFGPTVSNYHFYDSNTELTSEGYAELWVGTDDGTWAFGEVSIPYQNFLDNIYIYDNKNSGMTIKKRLTRLRQNSHVKNLDEYEDMADTEKIDFYRDERPILEDEWQIVLDFDSIELPNEEIIDIKHALVAMDVLSSPVDEDYYIYIFNCGENYALATYSGDIGGAVANAVVDRYPEWIGETAAFKATKYYEEMVPRKDRFGDLDGWYMSDLIENAERENNTEKLENIFISYYGDRSGSNITNILIENRKKALTKFLTHYGFDLSIKISDQPNSIKKIKDNVKLASINLTRDEKGGWISVNDKTLAKEYAKQMSEKYIEWLKTLADNYNLITPP